MAGLITTAFGAASTAAEVIAGIDPRGDEPPVAAERPEDSFSAAAYALDPNNVGIVLADASSRPRGCLRSSTGWNRMALPFFIGLVLGDYGISSLWALYFLATGHAGYRTFPI